MSYEEERIVKMTFDSKEFKSGVADTLKALEKLEKALDIDTTTSAKSFSRLTDSLETTTTSIGVMEKAVDNVKMSFSALQVVGMTVLSELTRSALNFGKKIYDNSLGQIKSGGLSRAMNIENAKFQLEGLGAEWNDIQDDLNYAVKDTAYGLDAAAKVASQLVASGLEIGDNMKTALRAVSGVAAMTNSSYEEIGNIFTTVASNGKLMTMQLRQLSARGLNVSAILKESFNTTEEAINDMVSKGKIGFAEFAEAMDNAFGEHAKEANKTFTGALSNMKAALSRIGEKFVTPFHEMERVIMTSVTPLINLLNKGTTLFADLLKPIENSFGLWVERLTETKGIQEGILRIVGTIYAYVYQILKAADELSLHLPDVNRIAYYFNEFSKSLAATEERQLRFREAMKDVLKILGIFLNVLFNIIEAAVPLIDLVLDFLEKFANNTDGLRDKVEDFANQVIVIFKFVVKLISLGLQKIIPFVGKSLVALVAIIKGVALVLAGLIAVITAVINKVVDFAKNFKENVAVIIHNAGVLYDAFVKFCSAIKSKIEGMGDSVATFVDSLRNGTAGILENMKGIFADKTLNIKTKLSVDTSKVSPEAIVQKGTDKALATTTKALGKYEEVSSKVSDNVGKIGATGGWFSGANANRGLIDTEALKKLTKVTEEAEEESDKARRLIPRNLGIMKKEVEEITGETETTVFSKMGKMIHDKLEDAEKSSSRETESFVDKVKERFKSATHTLAGIFEKFAGSFNSVFGVIVTTITGSLSIATIAITVSVIKLINSIAGLTSALPILSRSLMAAARGFKYQGMAEMFKGLALTLLAFGGLLAVIAVISNYCDPDNFKKIILYSSLLMVAVGVLAQAAAVISLAGSVKKLVNAIKDLMGATIVKKPKKKLKEINDFFKAIAVTMGTLVASFAILTAMVNYFPQRDLVKAGLLLTAMFAGIGLFIVLVTRGLRGGALASQSEEVSLLTKSFKRSSSNMLSGVTTLVMAMVPMILTMVGSIAILASLPDFDKTAKSFGILMASFAGLFLFVMTMILMIKGIVTKYKEADKTQLLIETFKESMTAVRRLVEVMSLFMISFVVSMKIMDTMRWTDIKRYATVLGIAAAALALMISTLFGAITLLAVASNRNYYVIKEVKSISNNMMEIIFAITAFIVSIAGAIALLTLVDQKNVWRSAGVLWITMGVMTAVVSVLMGAIGTFSGLAKSSNKVAKREGQTSIDTSENAAKAIKNILNAMSSFILSVSLSIGLISLIDDPEVLLRSCVAMAAMMFTMGIIIDMIGLMIKDFNGKTKKSGLLGTSKNSETKNFSTSVSDNTADVVKNLIMSMAMFSLAIAGSMIAVSKLIPKEDLFAIVAAFSVFMLVATGAMAGLIMTIKWFISATKGLDTKVMIKKMGALERALVTTVIAVAGLVVALVAASYYIDKLEDPTNFVAAAAAMGVIFISVIGFVLLLSKFRKVMPTANQLSGITTLMITTTAILMSIAGVMYVLQIIDFTNMQTAVGYLIGFASGLIIFMSIITLLSNYLTISMGGLIALGAVITSVAFVMVAFGYMTKLISQASLNFALAMSQFNSVEWDKAEVSTEKVTIIMNKLCAVAAKGALCVAAISIIGIAFKSLAEAFEIMSKIDPGTMEKLSETLFSIFVTFDKLWDVVGIIIAISLAISVLGPPLVVGIVGIIISLAMIPAVMKTFVKAMNSVTETITNSAGKIEQCVRIIKGLKDRLVKICDDSEMKSMLTYFLKLYGVAFFMSLAAGQLIVAAVLFEIADFVLEDIGNKIPKLIDLFCESLDVNKMASMVEASFLLFVASIFISVAAGQLAVGSLELAAVVGGFYLSVWLLKKAIDVLTDTFPEDRIDSISLAMEKLSGMIKAILLISALFFVIGPFMFAGATVFASTILVFYGSLLLLGLCIDSIVELFAKVSENLSKILITVAVTLASFVAILVGAIMMAPLLIVGGFIIGVSAGLIGMGAIALAGAALMFGAGIYLLAEAFNLLAEIDQETLEKAAENIGYFCVQVIDSILKFVNEIKLAKFEEITDELKNFVYQIAFLGIWFGIGAVALAIGSLAFLAAVYILELAFTKLIDVFLTIDSAELELCLIAIGALSIGLLTDGLLLMIGSLIFGIGAGLFLGAVYILSTAFEMLDKSLKNKPLSTMVVELSSLKNVTGSFLIASSQLLVGSGMFIGGSAILKAGSQIFYEGCSILSSGVALLASAKEGFGPAIEEFGEISKDCVLGLTDGFYNNSGPLTRCMIDTATDMIEAFRSKDGVDSHSAAKKFIEIALDCIDGLVKGFDEGEGSLTNKCKSAANGMVDAFEGVNWSELGKEIGKEIGEILGINLENFTNLSISNVAGNLAKLANFQEIVFGKTKKQELKALYAQRATVEQIQQQTKSDEGQKMLDKEWHDIDNQIKALEAESDSLLDDIFNIDEFIKSLINSVGGGGGGSISTPNVNTEALNTLANETASGAGKSIGSSANDLADMASSNMGTSIVNNNNYQFIQNNYSPEPIDRTELYVQTNNQLNTWYKWLGTQA